MQNDELLEDAADAAIDEARAELERMGVYFDGVSELETHGNLYSHIVLKGVCFDLSNRRLQQILSEANESWQKVFNAIALERLTGRFGDQVRDCVDVEEVCWSRRGKFVRLYVSSNVDELLEKFGLGDIDVGSMEGTLEGMLDEMAREILEKLNRALREYWRWFYEQERNRGDFEEAECSYLQ